MPYGYGSANKGSSGSSSRSYGPPGSSSRRSAPTHQPRSRPAPTVTTGGPPRVLNPPPVIPKGRTHPGGITGIKNRNILNWLKDNKWKAALYGTGALTAGSVYQTLSDINKIKGWTNMGYGTKNPVPVNMLSQLKGAWVPNKVFEKLGHGAGSTMNWLTKTIHPDHFKPVQTAMKAFKSPLGKLATRASLPATVGLTAFDLAMKSPTVQKYGTMLGEKIYDWTHKKDGGLIDLYRYGGFSG